MLHLKIKSFDNFKTRNYSLLRIFSQQKIESVGHIFFMFFCFKAASQWLVKVGWRLALSPSDLHP